MKRTLRLLAVVIGVAWVLFTPAVAQDDDGGFLTRTIEDLLSGAGREVRIEGFAGALSSEASFERMTIADDQGIWLTLEDVQLNWSRLALLRGRLEVNRLSAGRLDLPRLPEANNSVEVPSAEATEFALPDLPVSVNIETFEVSQIVLGTPVIGVAATLDLRASARLDDAGAALDLTATRVDGPEAMYLVQASFARETSELSVQMDLDESAGGLVGRMLDLPEQPSVDLTVAGTGPLEDFTADISLATNGATRLAGQVVLSTQPGAEESMPDRRIQADLGGDITALLAPASQEFFGPDVGLTVDAVLAAAGGVDVQRFRLNARAVQLEGGVRLNADNWPVFVGISGDIGRADAQAVRLPGGDTPTTVGSVRLRVDYDAAQNDAFSGRFYITALERDDLQFDQAEVILDGTLQGELGTVGRFLGDLDLMTQGLAFADPNATEALGQTLRGKARIDYTEDAPIRVTGLELRGGDFGLAGDIIIDGLAGGFPTDLALRVEAENLSRFAGLIGQPLAGAAALEVAGRITPLSSMFDLEIRGTTTDLAIDVPQADAVLVGETALVLTAKRDQSGTFVEGLDLSNAALEAQGDFALRTAGSRVSARASLRDIALVLPQYEGPVRLVVDATQDDRGWDVDLNADAPYDSQLAVQGRATGPDTDVQLRLSVPELEPLVASLQGPVDLAGRLWLTEAGYNVDLNAKGPYSSDLNVAGQATGPGAAVDFSAFLPDLGVFVPEIGGPLTIKGAATQAASGWQMDTRAEGPSGTQATIVGLVNEDGTLDLDIAGALPLGLSEPFLSPRSLQGQAQFDLAVKGPPALGSVSGQVTVDGARFAAPALRLTLNDLETTLDLADGALRIDAGGAVAAGGRLQAEGTLDLTSLAADLLVTLRSMGFADPALFSTVLDGAISVTGLLTGGAQIAGDITIGETLVTVPSSGLTSIGEIPDITHLGASPAVTATRRNANVIPEPETSGSGGSTIPYRLAVKVDAPRQIFVRGRGVDAELGGALEVTGTTARVVSAGQFDLVRGRIDILGQRFELVEGSIQFQGDLVPYILFETSSNTDSGTAGILLDGPATSPDVSFVSSPDAPQDQVLAQLLFGRDLSEISAFQALQLANAVATLAGRKGTGIIGGLREGFGLDDLDITTTDDGEAAVRAGKYISDNVYTDVVAGGGETELSINLDVTESLTARGSVEQDGNTGLGLFFERDY